MRRLLVHGRAQEGKSSKIVEDEWMAALRRGLAAAGVREPASLKIGVPFYGDKLIELLNRRSLPDADGIATRGGAMDDGYATFLEEVADQVTKDDTVTDRELDGHLGPTQERGLTNWEWVQAVIRVIDSRVPGVSNYSIGKLLRDVFIYVNDGPVRRAINRIVAAEVTGEPTLVVAHSLGSVVAYDVLREHARNAVPRLVTVGSPLGIRAISRRLASPLSMPNGVKAWYNAFDQRDVVALYPLDDRNFGIAPPVENYASVDNRTDNRHGIDGYLDDPKVAGQIAAGLRGS